MRYHVDPDQGTLWSTDTAVISIGDTREFLLREAQDYSQHHRYFVTGGDCVIMHSDCQERYQVKHYRHALSACVPSGSVRGLVRW